MARAPSPVVLNAAAAVLRYLARRKTRERPEELCARALGGEDTVSPQTIQRSSGFETRRTRRSTLIARPLATARTELQSPAA